MEEVVWAESRSPDQPYKLDMSTLPHVLMYNQVTDTFTLGTPVTRWTERKTGDNTTSRVPVFVGKTIEHIGYFQKRLVLISDNSVVMSRTDDIFNFWRQSATSLLVTDPVSIDASTTDIDKLNFITNHNRDLLILTRNAQLKIPGDVPVTPETIAMPLATSFNISVSAEPVPLGNAVMLPISYGSSSGLTRYEREQNREQDNANDISAHAVGLMTGTIKQMASSSNLEMVVVQTSVAPRTLYVYEQFTYAADNLQRSWCKWVFPFDIVSVNFVNDVLNILYRDPTTPNDLHVATIEMYTRVGELDKVFLDNSIELTSSNGSTVTIPTGYNMVDVVVVSVGETLRYMKIPYTVTGATLILNKNIGAGSKVVLGKVIEARYRPTRPFRKDRDGVVVTSDRIRINQFTLHVVNTGSVRINTVSDHYPSDEQVFIARKVGNGLLGERDLFTGDVVFVFQHDADLAEAEFSTDDYLGLTISGISWSGQYHQRKGRM
jgi:hypothetical protein